MKTGLLLVTLTVACKSSPTPAPDHATPTTPSEGSAMGSASQAANQTTPAPAAIALPAVEPIGAGPATGSLVILTDREVKPGKTENANYLVDVTSKAKTLLSKDSPTTSGPFEDGRTLALHLQGLDGKPDRTMLVRTGAKPTTIDGRIDAISPDGTRAIVGDCDKDHGACLAPFADGKLGAKTPFIPSMTMIAQWTPSGTIFVDAIGKLSMFADKNGKQIGDTIEIKTGNSIAVSPDGQWLAWSVKDDNGLAVAPVSAPTQIKLFTLPSTYAASCWFPGKGRLLCQLPGGDDDAQQLVTIELASGTVTTLSKRSFTTEPHLSPDGRYVAFSQLEGKAKTPRAAITPIDHADVQLLSKPGSERELVGGWIK
jgi:hypothetical protein